MDHKRIRMSMEDRGVQLFLSVVTMLAGIALMVFMIHTESEPGAVPLLMVLIGTGWFFITIHRSRT